jgi:hypothetical protein
MLHHFSRQLLARILALGQDDDVIQVALHPLIVNGRYDTVHASLKNRRSVAQFKGHDSILEGPHEALKGSAIIVAFLYAHLVVRVPKINLGKPTHMGRILDDLVYLRKGVKLLGCCLVYSSIVDANTCTTIFFLKEAQWSNRLGLQFADPPRFQH